MTYFLDDPRELLDRRGSTCDQVLKDRADALRAREDVMNATPVHEPPDGYAIGGIVPAPATDGPRYATTDCTIPATVVDFPPTTLESFAAVVTNTWAAFDRLTRTMIPKRVICPADVIRRHHPDKTGRICTTCGQPIEDTLYGWALLPAPAPSPLGWL